MKLTRYSDTAPVDYMVLADDGDWVPASEALALQERLGAATELLHRHRRRLKWAETIAGATLATETDEFLTSV